jgi:hypothetical protein
MTCLKQEYLCCVIVKLIKSFGKSVRNCLGWSGALGMVKRMLETIGYWWGVLGNVGSYSNLLETVVSG